MTRVRSHRLEEYLSQQAPDKRSNYTLAPASQSCLFLQKKLFFNHGTHDD